MIGLKYLSEQSVFFGRFAIIIIFAAYIGPTKGWGLVWRKLRKFFYFVFLFMLLGMNVYHTCEALEKVTDYYALNYSSNHQKQKEETMENNQKPENQAKNEVTQTIREQKSCHYIE